MADRWAGAHRIEGRRVSLRIEGAAGQIEADAAKLEQVLDALIDNAVCHAPEGDVEVVCVSAWKSDPLRRGIGV